MEIQFLTYQVKTTIKIFANAQFWQKCPGTNTCWWKYELSQLFRGNLAVSIPIPIDIFIDIEIPLLEIYFTDTFGYMGNGIYQGYHGNWIYNKRLEINKMSIKGKHVNKLCYIQKMEYFVAMGLVRWENKTL